MLSRIKRYQFILASTILCLVSFYLISANHHGRGAVHIMSETISFVSFPVRSAAVILSDSVSRGWNNYIYLIRVREENYMLKRRVADLTRQNNRLYEERLANQRLRNLLNLKNNKHPDAITANIISTDTDNFTKTVTIDKGSRAGIKRNQPVITSYGIVGKIIDVQYLTSEVILVGDPRFKAAVRLQRTRTRGIIEGNGSSILKIRYVRKRDDIRVGDRVITSGMGGIFPAGIMVGKITRIDEEGATFFKDVDVSPSVDMRNQAEEVLIISHTTTKSTVE